MFDSMPSKDKDASSGNGAAARMLFAQLTWHLDKRANGAMWQTRVLCLQALCPLTQLLLDGTHQVHVQAR